MPVRRNIVRSLAQRVVGIQVWNGRTGEPTTMPLAEWERATDATDQVYEDVIRGIDWKRICIEASSRHLQVHPQRGEGWCPECMQQVLLYDESGLGLSALHPWRERPTVPERKTRTDWPAVLAGLIRWRDKGVPDSGTPKTDHAAEAEGGDWQMPVPMRIIDVAASARRLLGDELTAALRPDRPEHDYRFQVNIPDGARRLSLPAHATASTVVAYLAHEGVTVDIPDTLEV